MFEAEDTDETGGDRTSPKLAPGARRRTTIGLASFVAPSASRPFCDDEYFERTSEYDVSLDALTRLLLGIST